MDEKGRCAAGVAAALLALGFAGCRTTGRVLDAYERDLSTGAYADAAADVAEFATGEEPWWNWFCPWRWPTFGAASADERSRTMWQLLYGGALYAGARPDEAIRQFDRAEDSFAANDRTSVFAQTGEGAQALLANDCTLTYDGSGQDRIFTCLYKAIDYAAQGKTAAVRTELNRCAQRQENWLWERRKDVSAASEQMEKDAAKAERERGSAVTNRNAAVDVAMQNAAFAATVRQKTGFDPRVDGNLDKLAEKDYVNVYAQHVCGVFRWISGDGGVAQLRSAAALRSGHPVLKDDAQAARAGVKPANLVWVYAEDGLCPARDEMRLDLPLVLVPGVGRYAPYVGMALPRLRERSQGAFNYSVTAGGQTAPLTELEDVDKLVKTEFDVYMRGALAREITRVIVKSGVQIALGCAADNTTDSGARLALKASQYTAAAWAASTTKADVRSWTALPKKVYMTRVVRPADGRIAIQIDGQRVETTIPEGNALVFVRKTGPSAGAVVKVAPFPNRK